MVWGVDKKEQGITVLLQLLSNNKIAEKTASNLTRFELYTDNGLNLLLEKLDPAFQYKDVKDTQFFFNLVIQKDIVILQWTVSLNLKT